MELETTADQELVLAIAASWDRLLGQLDSGLSVHRGITFAEYRLVRAIALAPGGHVSRVDLAETVRLSPSGVTRALRPLEKLGFVTTLKAERDARLALASLTAAGEELVSDASGIVDDIAASLLERAPSASSGRAMLVSLLTELTA